MDEETPTHVWEGDAYYSEHTDADEEEDDIDEFMSEFYQETSSSDNELGDPLTDSDHIYE